MTTPSTTLTAIRNGMLTTVEAIVPSVGAEVRFERHRGETDFRAWVGMNEQGALRRFSINMLFDEGPAPASTNSDVEFRSARMELNRLLGRRLHLTLWVKVRENWADNARSLKQLGLE